MDVLAIAPGSKDRVVSLGTGEIPLHKLLDNDFTFQACEVYAQSKNKKG